MAHTTLSPGGGEGQSALWRPGWGMVYSPGVSLAVVGTAAAPAVPPTPERVWRAVVAPKGERP
jgi:hypothetical protein